MRKDDTQKNKKTVEKYGTYSSKLSHIPTFTKILDRLYFKSKSKSKTENIPLTKKNSDVPSVSARTSRLKKKLIWGIVGLIGLSFYLKSLTNSNAFGDELKGIADAISTTLFVIALIGAFSLFLKTIKPLCLIFFSEKQTNEVVLPTIGAVIFISAFIGFFAFIITMWGK